MGTPKSQGRIVADFLGDLGRVCLVVYPDESWGILRDGETVSTWGPEQTADCVTAFVQMGGFDASVVRMGVREEQDGTCARRDRRSPVFTPADRLDRLGRGDDDYRFN